MNVVVTAGGYQEKARRLREQLSNLQPIPVFEDRAENVDSEGGGNATIESSTVLPPDYNQLLSEANAVDLPAREAIFLQADGKENSRPSH